MEDVRVSASVTRLAECETTVVSLLNRFNLNLSKNVWPLSNEIGPSHSLTFRADNEIEITIESL